MATATKAVANDSDKAQLLYETLDKHMFVFDIHDNGFAFGDYGCTVMKNVHAFWRKHFVLREKMEQVYFPAANPTWSVRPEIAEKTFTYLEQYFRRNEIFKLPYTAAQLTQKAVRCEESSRHHLVNVNESTFGEIEHFMELEDSSHPKFYEVSDLKFPMCLRDGQTAPRGRALSQVIANNQTLAFFIGRVYLFLKELGIDENRLRFRQLPFSEMTPDAADCWVVEIESSSYGWLICGRITHRSTHACKKAVITLDKEELRRAFKDDHKTVRKALKARDYEKAVKMKYTLEQKQVEKFKVGTLQVSLTGNMVSVSTETITPSLIKLSLWLDQIIPCIYEQSFYLGRDNENQQLCVFRFTPPVAPIKCAISVMDPTYESLAESISEKLEGAGVVNEVDISGNFVRTDELGVPFTVVVVSPTSVKIRERDSNVEIPLPMENVVSVVKDLTNGHYTWGAFMDRTLTDG